MEINNIEVVGRFNRPSWTERLALEVFFINDGVYQDPYEISGVTIFTNSDYTTSTLLDSDTQLVSGVPKMAFAASSTLTSDDAFATSSYSIGTDSSGIYKLGTGHFAVVLDNTVDLSGVWDGSVIGNAASSVGEYVDIWAVKHTAASEYMVYINNYRLFDDTFVGITQRLITKASTKLTTKSFELGEKKNLIFTNDITVQNKDIDQSIKNIFKDTVVTSGAVEIKKLNEGHSLPSQIEVSGFSDTSSLVEITPNNEIIYLLDTEDLKTKAATTEDFGSPQGVYSARVKFTLLNETIISPPLTFKVV